ncbi:MAG: hypothetical protein QM702_21320 [Rubrivivax sp.]
MPLTNWFGPLLNVCVEDGITFAARSSHSRDFVSERLFGSTAGPLASDV